MDLLSCWHTGPIHRCYRNRGYSRWDEDGDTTCDTVQLAPGLSRNTGSLLSMDDIVNSDTLLTIDDSLLPLLGSNKHFRKVYEFLCSEKCYLDEMCCALDVYVEPLHNMPSLVPEEVRIFFCDLEPLAYCSRDLCIQLRNVITKWDGHSTQIGHLFNDGFWKLYEAYSSHYFHISRLLTSKCSTDSELADFCRRMESLGKPSIHFLLDMPTKRLASYANELKEMASILDSNNPDVPLLQQAANEAASRLAKLRKSDVDENDLKQIQEHFQQDDLHLMDKDVQCSSGSRWRSSVTKTLIGGGLKKASMLSSSIGSMSSPDTRCVVPERQLILSSAVKLGMGVHSRERFLFLFNDFLIIAKGRFDTNFRLKNKILTSSLWVTSFSAKTLIIGWPTQNSTFTYESSYQRDLWLANLKEAIKTEKAKEALQSMQIKIIKKDCEYTAIKSLLVANNETASHVVERCLDEFHILDATVADFQLCVASTEDDTTFSLSGHEYPFTIWMNSSQTSAEVISDAKIQFILRSNKKTVQPHTTGESSKPIRKGRALKRLFKKPAAKQGHLKLFGRELSELFEQDASIPYPVMQMLRKLYADGPHTDGLFRKSANHTKLLAVKQSLDCGESVNFDEIPVLLTAVLLKEFLRNLPNCLLNCQMYHEWMKTVSIPNHEEQITSIKHLIQMLPPCNQLLLRHLVCVLCNLASHSAECKMDASNLAICIGQSLLWTGASVIQKEDARNANILVQKMIEFAADIFGPDCVTLLDGADVVKRPKQMVLRGNSADSGNMQSTGEADDSVCHSLDLKFTSSCSEADYSPVVPDKAGFKMQSSQSCDSGLPLGDEVRECRGTLSASKVPLSAKIKYYASSESREEEEEDEEEEEEEDCIQLMPKKLRHSKKKQAPAVPVLQHSSSMDTISSVQSPDSLCVHSIEYPHKESVDQSSLSFSDVLPTESCIEPSDPSAVRSSKRTLFFQSLLQPTDNSFNMSLGQSMNVFITPKPVKCQNKLSTNDSGVSFLGSLNNNSEEISDAEYGRLLLLAQKNQSPSVDVRLEQEHFSSSLLPFSSIQQNLDAVDGHQFDQMRRRPPPLSELHGTTFAEKCLETPEELKENKLECAIRVNTTSTGNSAFTTEGFTSDSADRILDESCQPDACMNRLAKEKESRQQDSSLRRPLLRANAIESDSDQLKRGTTAEKLKHISSLSSIPSAANTTCNRMTKQNSSVDKTNSGRPIYDQITVEKVRGLLHHDRPSEQHSPSSVRKFSEECSGTRQLIAHCKSLDNVSLGADSKNVIHLAQNKSPSHGSLLINQPQAQEMRVQISTEMNCLQLLKCKDISNSLHSVASLSGVAQYKARRWQTPDNKIDKAQAVTFKSKQFGELRSFYDRSHEKGSVKSSNAISECFPSSDQNIRPRLTKKRSKNRYIRKRNSDPRLNAEGKRGSNLERSKSDSSDHCRNIKLILQVNSRNNRSEVEQLKENFSSLENIVLQKKIERSGKSMSAKDLSAASRKVNHHNENAKRKSVTIKDRDWHTELAKQYTQKTNPSNNLSPSGKSDLSPATYRFGREVKESVHKSVNDSHGSIGGGDGKTSKVGGICLSDRLTSDVFDKYCKDMSHHASKSSQKTGLICSGLTSSCAKPRYPTTPEMSYLQGLKSPDTSVRELRENFIGLPLNSDTSQVSDNCSKTYVASPSSVDSLVGKGSGRPLCETVGRIMDDAQLLDPANISWSVARLKELYSSQQEQSANRKLTHTSHSKSEDWCSSKKASDLPRLG